MIAPAFGLLPATAGQFGTRATEQFVGHFPQLVVAGTTVLVERHRRVTFAEQHRPRRDLVIELVLILDQRAAEIVIPMLGVAERKQIVSRFAERAGDGQTFVAVGTGRPIFPGFVIVRAVMSVVVAIKRAVFRKILFWRLVRIGHGFKYRV